MTEIKRLHYETVTPLLRETLGVLMQEELFRPFRLVGGTNLSLRYGHRKSDDIDLFTDAEYRSLDFRTFEVFLRSHFPYYHCTDTSSIVSFGRSYYVGKSEDEYVKVDLMYSDPFLEDAEVIDGIRMAGVKDIVAMKMHVVSQGGRKKDFWDLHRLLKEYTLPEMIGLHAKRYEWEHDEDELLDNFVNFTKADTYPDPVCLLGKDWQVIQFDLIKTAKKIRQARCQDITPQPRSVPDVSKKLAAQPKKKRGL